MNPQFVGPDGIGEFETPLGEDVVVLARGDEPGGDFDLLDFTIPPGPGGPQHIHHDNDETFYLLEGELVLRIGDDQQKLTPGSYAFGPRGVPHGYRNPGDRPARMLVMFTPGNFVAMSEELDELGFLAPEDESDMERMAPIFEKYSLEMVGPSLGEE